MPTWPQFGSIVFLSRLMRLNQSSRAEVRVSDVSREPLHPRLLFVPLCAASSNAANAAFQGCCILSAHMFLCASDVICSNHSNKHLPEVASSGTATPTGCALAIAPSSVSATAGQTSLRCRTPSR